MKLEWAASHGVHRYIGEEHEGRTGSLQGGTGRGRDRRAAQGTAKEKDVHGGAAEAVLGSEEC